MLSDSFSEELVGAKNHYSGDPFVDAGLIAIELITEKPFDDCSKEDLKKASEWLVNLYMKPAWAKEIYSIFPNSKYINSKDKKKDSLEFLNSLINNLDEEESDEICIFCGRPAYTHEKIYKSYIPLTGTGKFVNYFPSFQNGMTVCPKCLLAFQFFPVITYKAGGKPCLVSSNNANLIYKFGEEALKSVEEKLADGFMENKDSSGIYDENFKNPLNALFNLAYKFGTEYCRIAVCNEDDTIILYRIDNYNQNPTGIEIYKLPSNVFSFVAAMMKNPAHKKDWFSLISPYYLGSGDKDEEIPFWKRSPNRVYQSLLDGQSILWAFRDDKKKCARIAWEVVEVYEKKVRYMKQQRIEDIKKFSDRIAESIEAEGKVKKRVNDIVSAKNLPEFRNQLRIISKNWQNQGKKESLVSYDEYVSVLIPGDYKGWTEVRDLMVIRLYEKLHDYLSGNDEDNENT